MFVNLFAVVLDDVHVAPDHLEGRVAEQLLEREWVAAAAQVGDGKGVAEAVRMAIGDAGSPAHALHQGL